MKTDISHMLWMPLALAAVACTSPAEPEPAGPEPGIAFTGMGMAEQQLSRADDHSPLYLSCDNFAVVATKTLPDDGGLPLGEMQLVFPGYRVEYGTEWVYEGVDYTYYRTDGTQYLKYWDLSAAKYSFTAVSPAPDNSAGAPVGFRNTRVDIDGGEISLTGIKGNLSTGTYTGSTGAPDWMVARTVRTATPLADTDSIDATCNLHAKTPLTLFHDPVPLLFHPILSRVTFQLYSTPGVLILQKFAVTVADGQEIVNTGDYSTATGWSNTGIDEAERPLVFGEYTYNDGKVLSNDPDKPTLMASHVEIPQSWADPAGRKLHIYVETKDGTVYEGDIVLDRASNGSCSWLPATHYVYTLRINTEAGTDQKILFTVDIFKWQWLKGSSTEDTQTNW